MKALNTVTAQTAHCYAYWRALAVRDRRSGMVNYYAEGAANTAGHLLRTALRGTNRQTRLAAGDAIRTTLTVWLGRKEAA